ncbi:AaceriAFR152Cp [[Ashbya] aceris (nom. inval.)]|nr:AaceriAFR152Cp [[Ashbya] aceris (nom. inval.)]
MDTRLAVEVSGLSYKFPHAEEASLTDVDLALPWRKRMLLCGSNGAGKSTLLKLLSGKHLCRSGNIRVDGRDPFAPANTADPADVMVTAYLGTEWCHMAIVHRDIGVQELLDSVGLQHYLERGTELLRILDVDPRWRMHRLSDGQKRRVQLCMGLLKPFKLLLLDEVTVDLDVVARAKLLHFLRLETERRECSIIYATHIFDGLADWPDRIVHIAHGRVLADLDVTRDISFAADHTDVVEAAGHVRIGHVRSLHPLALAWLARDEGKTAPE